MRNGVQDYSASFSVDKDTDGKYRVALVRMDSEGNKHPLSVEDDDKNEDTVKEFLNTRLSDVITDSIESFINDDDKRIDDTVDSMLDLVRISMSCKPDGMDDLHCSTATDRAEVIRNLDSLWNSLPMTLKETNDNPVNRNQIFNNHMTVTALAASICVLECWKDNGLFRLAILTAMRNAKAIGDGRRFNYYVEWFMEHLLGGSMFFLEHHHDNPEAFDSNRAFITDFMIGGVDYASWYDDLYSGIISLDIEDTYEDSIEDLLDPDNALAFEKLENCKVNIGFALATRPSSIGLADALAMLPKMKTRVEEWLGKDEYVNTHSPVFETWDVLAHDWDEATMFNIPKIRYYSNDKYSMVPIAYGQSAVRMLDTGKVDPDKVVGLFRSIVPDPIHGDSEVTEFRRRFSQTVVHKLWAIIASAYYLSVNTSDSGYMRAMVWLVNLYARLLDHSPVEIYHNSEDGKADLAYYRCPKLTFDMLPKIVKYYDDGMPMSFIMETLLASIATEDDDELYCYEDVHIENMKGDSPFARRDPACNETYLISSNDNTEESLC